MWSFTPYESEQSWTLSWASCKLVSCYFYTKRIHNIILLGVFGCARALRTSFHVKISLSVCGLHKIHIFTVWRKLNLCMFFSFQVRSQGLCSASKINDESAECVHYDWAWLPAPHSSNPLHSHFLPSFFSLSPTPSPSPNPSLTPTPSLSPTSPLSLTL